MLFTFMPLRVPIKAIYLPGVGAKKDGCEAVLRPGAKKKYWCKKNIGPKKEECEKGRCEAVSYLGAEILFRALCTFNVIILHTNLL